MSNNSDKFYARVQFNHIGGASLDYFYSKENLLNVKPEHIKFDNSYGFSIGREVMLGDKKYIIKDIT